MTNKRTALELRAKELRDILENDCPTGEIRKYYRELRDIYARLDELEGVPTVTEKRTLSMHNLWNLCIRNKWYTRGTNEEYGRLLSSVHDDKYEAVEMTTEKLAELAADIMRHSDMPADYDICCVMYELAKVCETCFETNEL